MCTTMCSRTSSASRLIIHSSGRTQRRAISCGETCQEMNLENICWSVKRLSRTKLISKRDLTDFQTIARQSAEPTINQAADCRPQFGPKGTLNG